MPVDRGNDSADYIHTRCIGRVSDDDLLGYYSTAMFEGWTGRWLELVDAREISEMAITPAGLRKLAGRIEPIMERLRGGRVAMVARDKASYGMFRMWEMQREHLPYAVRVFDDFDAGLSWLRNPEPDVPPG